MNSRFPRLTSVTKLVSTMVFLLSAQAFAGTRDTGGGTGIMVGPKLIVLDLVEAGLETEASIPELTPDADILSMLQANLRLPEEYKSQVLIPLAKKLTDVAQGGSHTAAMLMARAFGYYKFQAVSYKLTAIDDVDSAIGEQRLQIAVRKGPTIYISKQNWALLDETNRVALLMHEILYAFQPLPTGCSESAGFLGRTYTSCGDSTVDGILATSSKTRYFTSFLFRKDWRKTWKTELKTEMKVGSDESTYSSLFPIMSGDADGKTKISKFQKGEEWQADTIFPMYRAIQVWGIRKYKAVLTKKSSLNDLYRMCAGGEFTQGDVTNPNSFLNTRIEMMRRQGYGSIQMTRVELKYDLDVLTTGRNTSNEITIESIPETRENCVKQLQSVQKNYLL